MAERYPIKLVRDRIRDVAPNVHGGSVEIWAVGSTSGKKLLRQKLLEEVGEYLIDPSPDELVDILEVVEALAAKCHGVGFEGLRKAQMQKRRERGAFDDYYVMYAVPAQPLDSDTGGER